METHSSILAWKIPWTEEPSELQHIASKSRTRLKQPSTHTWKYRETKAARVPRTEYQRRQNYTENFTDLQRKCS